MDNEYPTWICHTCGWKYGLRKPQPGDTATYHMGTCGVCKKDVAVTEPRDFGHLRSDWRAEQQDGREA